MARSNRDELIVGTLGGATVTGVFVGKTSSSPLCLSTKLVHAPVAGVKASRRCWFSKTRLVSSASADAATTNQTAAATRCQTARAVRQETRWARWRRGSPNGVAIRGASSRIVHIHTAYNNGRCSMETVFLFSRGPADRCSRFYRPARARAIMVSFCAAGSPPRFVNTHRTRRHGDF